MILIIDFWKKFQEFLDSGGYITILGEEIPIFGLIATILGIIITWLSTFFAVRKYLRIKNDNLYY